MKIPIDISKKCIASGARKAYEDRLKQCLRSPSGELDALEREIEALKTFLEDSDFPDLRSRHPALAGGQEKNALLHVLGPGDFAVEVLGQSFVPKKRER